MKRKYYTASGKNGSNQAPEVSGYKKQLLYHSKDRIVHEVMQAIAGLSNKEAASAACAPGTIRAWRRPVRDGGTRYPRSITLNAVLHAHGKRLKVVDL